MSSSMEKVFNTNSDHGPSLEDLRLFQRLMRIARLLETHDPEDTYYRGLSTDQHGTHGRGNASKTEQVTSIEDENGNDSANSKEGSNKQNIISGENRSNTVSAAKLGEPFGPGNSSAHFRQLRQSRNKQGSVAGASAQHRHQQRQRPHAAIEKRYRSVLNSKIQQLQDIIPASTSFTTNSSGVAPGIDETTIAQKAPSKSAVLDRAIQYINYLVYTYEQYEKEQDELVQKLQQWLDVVPPATEKSIDPGR